MLLQQATSKQYQSNTQHGSDLYYYTMAKQVLGSMIPSAQNLLKKQSRRGFTRGRYTYMMVAMVKPASWIA